MAWYGRGSWIFSDDCPGVFQTDGYAWPSAISLANPKISYSLLLHSVDFEFDGKSERKVKVKYGRLRKLVPDEGLVFIQTGLFETRRD